LFLPFPLFLHFLQAKQRERKQESAMEPTAAATPNDDCGTNDVTDASEELTEPLRPRPPATAALGLAGLGPGLLEEEAADDVDDDEAVADGAGAADDDGAVEALF
jgi:hypothetical protein